VSECVCVCVCMCARARARAHSGTFFSFVEAVVTCKTKPDPERVKFMSMSATSYL
jgi:hypothetical protein